MPETVHVGSGKVRELYALDDERLLLTASDRISVFDVVLPTEIPDKGRVLTGLSGFWFGRTSGIVPNHLLTIREDGRSMECRRLLMLPIECVVRGYLSGSGWKSYQESGEVCGIALPEGLRESDRLPEPIFTPTTKAAEGHDEPLTAEQAADLVGDERFAELEQISIELYRTAAEYAAEKGIIIADTKFELGLDEQGNARPRRRGLHPGLLALLARGRVRARRAAAVLRQAVRPRLRRVARLGQDPAGPRAARGGRRGNTRPLPRGFRADHRHPLRRVRGQAAGGPRMKATVLVRPKPGILDPQGKAVEASLRHLGFAVDDARIGRLVDLEVEASDPEQARAEVERMCAELLANPLIESYEIELAEDA